MFGLTEPIASAGDAHACRMALQLKFITRRTFCCGHTRSSREVTLGRPSSGGPICPRTFGFDGSLTSTIITPALGWEPSVRLPTYTYVLPVAWSWYRAGAAFIPRSISGSCPTSEKLRDVPGEVGFGPPTVAVR